MDPDPVTRRFPLIARPRPTCPPLDERIRQLVDMARTAHHHLDRTLAATVQNKAALIASDCGLHDLARELCWRHFHTYLNDQPLDAQSARHALEPLVNLARLLIRTGDGDNAHQLLTTIHHAVRSRSDATIAGRPVSFRNLTQPGEEHRTLCQWLWTVLLADGTRALAGAGRWRESLAHAEQYNGIGDRLLDGRQVAVLAHLHTGDPTTALSLVGECVPTEAWEQAVKACLTAYCLTHTDQPAAPAVTALVDRYLPLPTDPGLVLFHARLGLTALDLAGTTGQRTNAERAATRLLHHTLTTNDAYAAREVLNHPPCRSCLTATQRSTLSKTRRSAGLDHNTIPHHLLSDLHGAVDTAQAITTREQHQLLA
jgi:hypothetical protein